MEITRVETIPILVPWPPTQPGRTPGSQSRGRFEDASPEGTNTFFVKIHTDEDIIGLGDGWWIQPKCEHLFIDDYLGPAIVGMDPFDVGPIHSKMRHIEMHLFERLGPMRDAEAAIDIALYDIVGKALKKPICELIGGSFRETIPLGPAAVPGVTTPVEEMVEVAKKAYERGSRAIKVKVGADVDKEVKRVKALREALGDDVKLIVDANQGWTPKVAIKTINRMDKYDLQIAEQPVAFWDLKGMALVRKSVEPLVMADESLGCEWDALNLIRHEAADMFYMYVMKSPGIYNSMRIIAIGEPAGVDCWIFGGGVLSQVATLHVCAAKNTGLGEAMFHPPVLGWMDRQELLSESLKVSPKGVEVPRGHGLGVDLDWRKVEKYRRSKNSRQP